MKCTNVSYNCNEIRVILYQHLTGVEACSTRVDDLARIIKSLSPNNQAGLAVAVDMISDGKESKGI